jgi:phosphoglycerol transferase MdoB-like AlkP superfamily enzyme
MRLTYRTIDKAMPMRLNEVTKMEKQPLKTGSKNRFYILMLTFLVALVVADGTITRFLIKNQLGVEANPFLKEWVKSDILLLLKLVGATASAFILWYVYKRSPKLAWVITWFLIVVYVSLILWNLVAFYITGIQIF